jgi:hypothetical protein
MVEGHRDSGLPVVRATEDEALANVRAVLQLCASGKLRCSEKTRLPGAATVAVVSQALVCGDFYPDEPISAFAWPLLVQAGGLAELAGGRLQLTARGRAALSAQPAGTIAALWKRWVSHGVVDEFSRVEAIKGQRSVNALSAVRPRREVVARALAACPPAEWVKVDDLFATMLSTGLNPRIARSERALWRLYISDPQYGTLGYEGVNDWLLLQGRYTLAVIFEYAATLGLVDVEYTDPVDARDDYRDQWGADDLDYLSRYDGLRAVRLNALGGCALGLTGGRYEPGERGVAAGSLTVLPNRDIVATADLAPADRLLLSAFARQTSERVWTLDASTLLAAIDSGRRVEELTGFLAVASRHEVPAAVTTVIADAAARVRQLSDRGVCRVVECADPALAMLIARDRVAGPACRQLGDRHLAVRAEDEPAFRKALRRLGYVLPAEPQP